MPKINIRPADRKHQRSLQLPKKTKSSSNVSKHISTPETMPSGSGNISVQQEQIEKKLMMVPNFPANITLGPTGHTNVPNTANLSYASVMKQDSNIYVPKVPPPNTNTQAANMNIPTAANMSYASVIKQDSNGNMFRMATPKPNMRPGPTIIPSRNYGSTIKEDNNLNVSKVGPCNTNIRSVYMNLPSTEKRYGSTLRPKSNLNVPKMLLAKTNMRRALTNAPSMNYGSNIQQAPNIYVPNVAPPNSNIMYAPTVESCNSNIRPTTTNMRTTARIRYPAVIKQNSSGNIYRMAHPKSNMRPCPMQVPSMNYGSTRKEDNSLNLPKGVSFKTNIRPAYRNVPNTANMSYGSTMKQDSMVLTNTKMSGAPIDSPGLSYGSTMEQDPKINVPNTLDISYRPIVNNNSTFNMPRMPAPKTNVRPTQIGVPNAMGIHYGPIMNQDCNINMPRMFPPNPNLRAAYMNIPNVAKMGYGSVIKQSSTFNGPSVLAPNNNMRGAHINIPKTMGMSYGATTNQDCKANIPHMMPTNTNTKGAYMNIPNTVNMGYGVNMKSNINAPNMAPTNMRAPYMNVPNAERKNHGSAIPEDGASKSGPPKINIRVLSAPSGYNGPGQSAESNKRLPQKRGKREKTLGKPHRMLKRSKMDMIMSGEDDSVSGSRRPKKKSKKKSRSKKGKKRNRKKSSKKVNPPEKIVSADEGSDEDESFIKKPITNIPGDPFPTNDSDTDTNGVTTSVYGDSDVALENLTEQNSKKRRRSSKSGKEKKVIGTQVMPSDDDEEVQLNQAIKPATKEVRLNYMNVYAAILNMVKLAPNPLKYELANIKYPMLALTYLRILTSDDISGAQKFLQKHQKTFDHSFKSRLERLEAVQEKRDISRRAKKILLGDDKFQIFLTYKGFCTAISNILEWSPIERQLMAQHFEIIPYDTPGKPRQPPRMRAGNLLRIYYAVPEPPREMRRKVITRSRRQKKEKNDGDEGEEMNDMDDSTETEEEVHIQLPRLNENMPNGNYVFIPPIKNMDMLRRKNDDENRVKLDDKSLPSIFMYTMFGNNDEEIVICATFNENATMLAVGTDSSHVYVYGLTTSKLPQLIPVEGLQSLKNDMAGIDRQMWDPENRYVRRTLIGHTGPVYSCAFAPDEYFLLSCSEDVSIRLWNMYTWDCVVVYYGHVSAVLSVVYAPYGFYFATGSDDCKARIWAQESTRPARTLAGHLAEVTVCLFHPNTHYLATGSADCTIRFWDITTAMQMRLFLGHKDTINVLAFSRCGQFLISGGFDNYVIVWDAVNEAIVKCLNHHTGPISTIECDWNNHIFVVGSNDCQLSLWDFQKMRNEYKPAGLCRKQWKYPGSSDADTSEDDDYLIQSYPSRDTPFYKVCITRRNLVITFSVKEMMDQKLRESSKVLEHANKCKEWFLLMDVLQLQAHYALALDKPEEESDSDDSSEKPIEVELDFTNINFDDYIRESESMYKPPQKVRLVPMDLWNLHNIILNDEDEDKDTEQEEDEEMLVVRPQPFFMSEFEEVERPCDTAHPVHRMAMRSNLLEEESLDTDQPLALMSVQQHLARMNLNAEEEERWLSAAACNNNNDDSDVIYIDDDDD